MNKLFFIMRYEPMVSFGAQIQTRREEFHLFQTQNRNTDTFFCRRTHEQKKHGFTFLESMKVQKIRIQSFCKLKMLRHAQIQSVNTAKCFRKLSVPFFTNANGTQMFFSTKCFPKKWGQALCACVGPPGPPPFFWEKHFD